MRFSIGAICCLFLALALSPATAAAPAEDPAVRQAKVLGHFRAFIAVQIHVHQSGGVP